MGLFGGGNSSSSTRTTTASGGFSQISGPALQLQGNANSVQFIDPGALKAAQTIAGEALNQVDLAQQNANGTANSAIQAVAQASQGQAQSLLSEGIKWGAILGIGYIALKAFGK